jgi:glycosyltransferase involved in cell wall biosynthesis
LFASDLLELVGMDQKKGKRIISVIVPEKDVYSETFIRAHIDRLPAKVKALYGYPFPRETGDKDSLYIPSGILYRVRKLVGAYLWGYSERLHQQRILERYLLRNNVQAVLAEYGHTGVAMMGVCREVKIPLIVHFHGHDAYDSKILDYEGKSYPELFENSAALIVVSKDMYHQLIQLGAPSEKLFLNPCGVDVSQFIGADPANADPVFISVGRFVDKKAPHLILLAFHQIFESNPEARLIMIGDGPLLESCFQLAQALAISGAVEFKGACAHDQVVKEMQLAKALVQHSIRTTNGDSEGTPVAVLEACAAGLPVVATRHAGIKDVILNGETGLLVEEKDIDGMAEAMNQILLDPLLAARLGKSGRERVEKDFSMAKSINELWAIIETTIDKYKRNST